MKNSRLVRVLFFSLVVIDLGLLLVLCCQPGGWSWLGHAAAGERSPEPELFAPGIISTPDDEVAASLSPDGRTLLFSRSGAIWESHLENGHWGEARSSRAGEDPKITSTSPAGTARTTLVR